MLAGLSAAQIVSWGVLYYSFAVFVQPIERETGWSRAEVMGAFSLALLVSGVAAVAVGHWIDRRGARVLMASGTALAVALLLVLSTVGSLPAFYATWAGLGLAMAMTLYEPAFALVARWFVRQRDRALTVLTACGGLASTLLVPLSTWLVTTQGWRSGAVALALLLASTSLPIHAFALRDAPGVLERHAEGAAPAPAESTPRPTGVSLGPVLADARFWSLALALALASLVSVATTVHVVPYLMGRGASAAAAGAVLGLTGVMQLPGRIVFEPIRRRLSSRALLAASLLSQALGLLLLIAGTSRVAVVVFACLFGAGAGLATLLRASMIAELYGLERYGRASGVVSLFTTAGRAAGPVAAALALGLCGSYRPVLAGLALALGLATVIALFPPSSTSPGDERPALARHVA
jgi:MFS family permease